jgi:hypothetical protein
MYVLAPFAKRYIGLLIRSQKKFAKCVGSEVEKKTHRQTHLYRNDGHRLGVCGQPDSMTFWQNFGRVLAENWDFAGKGVSGYIDFHIDVRRGFCRQDLSCGGRPYNHDKNQVRVI